MNRISNFQLYNMLKKLIKGAAFMTALFLLGACGASKEAHQLRLILQGADSLDKLPVALPELQIQKGDLLTIMVFSDNKEATEIYNQPQSSGATSIVAGGAGGNVAGSGRGYLVDVNGNIYFHSLGTITAAGTTKRQLAEYIKENLKQYLQNPYVVVRFMSAKVTVMGEVNRPGQLDLPDQRLSLLDAIALSGDMTPFARRDNVLLIREEDGVRKVQRFDLRNSDMYKTEDFYLKQNDLIYLEPNRKKPTGNEQVLVRNISIGTGVLSAIALLITLITR